MSEKNKCVGLQRTCVCKCTAVGSYDRINAFEISFEACSLHFGFLFSSLCLQTKSDLIFTCGLKDVFTRKASELYIKDTW